MAKKKKSTRDPGKVKIGAGNAPFADPGRVKVGGMSPAFPKK